MQAANHILCLVADEASAALSQAAHLACRAEATLHAMPIGGNTRDAVERALQSVERPASGACLHDRLASPPLEEGGLTEHVQAYVQEEAIDLVVVDTPSDRGPVPPLATALTKEVIQALDCSVFVVEHNADPSAIQHILVPTDLSESALATVRYATRLASIYDAAVDLLHVIEAVPYVALTPVDRLSLSATSFPEHRARRRLASLVEKSPLSSDAFQTHFEYGDPADQIGRFVNQEAVDLLVLSSKSVSSSSRVQGPVADRVLRRVTCPVVVVRSGGESSSSGESTAASVTETTE
ncbi:hypothetical protein BSZ35_11800 [Salinibacter sp. 10B]|uniref:universal stress protein n=1 Tax=Salinibacter sp. 10B TaxID=1923971 RepID=UPI000D28930B|nr:universal stress protein [Salinibacter sp. 10B]PQJ35184.1 hypothetical protein BSZ35_11800 [Salinibacter sp. 10B]